MTKRIAKLILAAFMVASLAGVASAKTFLSIATGVPPEPTIR